MANDRLINKLINKLIADWKHAVFREGVYTLADTQRTLTHPKRYGK